MKFTQDLKTIFFWLKPFKREMIIFSILAAIASAVSAFIPFLYGYLVDSVIAHKEIFYISSILLFWLVLSIITDYINRYNDYHGAIIAVSAETNLIRKISNHVLKLPLAYLHKNKIGEIIRKINFAANHLEGISWIMIMLAPKFLTVIIALIFLLFINYWLATVLFIIIIIYLVITLIKTKPIVKANKPLNEKFEKAYGDLYDTVHNTEIVKSNSNIEYEKQRAFKNFSTAVKSVEKFNWTWRNLTFWQQMIFSIGFVGLFAFSLFLLYKNLITAGNLVTFIGYISLVFAPLADLANNYRIFRRGVDSIDRANVIYRQKPEDFYRRGKKTIEKIKGEIVFKNVFFDYEKKNYVLKNINVKIKPGEIVALVGKTGAGKSTFVDLVSGYYLADKGKIFIDNIDICDLDVEKYRQHIAYVPQEISMFNDTVLYNIKYGRMNANMKEIERAAIAANADEFINKLPKKYKTVVGERGVKLSVGQKQRVAIARAILRDPEILILDEATSSLDSVTEKLVQEALERLIKSRTTLVIAHRLSTIVRADRILVIENGKIVEQGTHHQLLKKSNGKYKYLYNTQTILKK